MKATPLSDETHAKLKELSAHRKQQMHKHRSMKEVVAHLIDSAHKKEIKQ